MHAVVVGDRLIIIYPSTVSEVTLLYRYNSDEVSVRREAGLLHTSNITVLKEVLFGNDVKSGVC